MQSKEIPRKSTSGDNTRFPKGSKPPAETKFPAKVSRKEILSYLEGVAPMGKILPSLLKIPANAYIMADSSFSSDPKKSLEDAVESPFPNIVLPSHPADYHLALSSRGSHVFCILVDKTRKIMVSSSVRSMYVKQGSWVGFQRTLEKTLAALKDAESKGEKFSFLVNNENTMRLL